MRAEAYSEDLDRGWLTRVPEYLGLLALGALVAITYQGIETLPERIAVHFGATGQPDGWGPKSTLYVTLAIAGGMYLLLTLVQRIPDKFNYPVRVTDENRARLQRLSLGLLRWVKVEMAGLFTFVQWTMVEVGLGRASGMSPLGIFAWIGLLLLTVAFFTAWLVRSK